MENKKYIYVSVATFFLGLFFLAFQKEWLIFNLSSKRIFIKNSDRTYFKKKIKLFFWKNDKWNWESNDILWSSDQAINIKNLVQSWLILLEDEKITRNKITLQSALITQNEQIAYLSFDQLFFSEECATYKKLMLIESLLKTLQSSGLKVLQVQFLMHHQVMPDTHLDFSNPWPLSGFIS